MDKQVIKKVFSYIRHYWIFLAMSIVMAAVTVILTLYLPILSGRAIDHIIGKGLVDFGAIVQILIRMAIVIGVTAIAQWLMNVCNNRLTFYVVKEIRQEAIKKIEILPLKYIDAHPYGEIVSKVMADVDLFADGLLMGFTQFFTGVATILGTLIFMLSINLWITLVVVLITPLSFLVAGFIAKKTYTMFSLQSKTRGEQTALIDEMIGNQKVVQAFGQEDEVQEKFDEINGRLEKCSLRAIFFSSLTNPCTRFVNNVVYAGVGITGALAAVTGRLTVGQLSCFLNYANQYTKPFNEISGVITELQNALACAGRIFELIEEEPQIPDAENAETFDKVEGHVELSDVSFSYVPEQRLIEHFNLKVDPGQRIAIVGPTGCGKTTLINLLMRFYEVNQGVISVEGKDITSVTRKSLRSAYGMVLQETWLKGGTIRENLTMGKPDATEEEMIAAAKAAHAHSFIKRMPEGYDTVLGASGRSLSGGEKQRISIARAILANPKILILDEATAAVDTETELAIQESLEKLVQGRTTLSIAHRLSTLRNADKLIGMEDGKVTEEGTHKELIEKKGTYFKLMELQTKALAMRGIVAE